MAQEAGADIPFLKPLFILSSVMNAVDTVYPPLMNFYRYKANQLWANQDLPPQILAQLRRSKIITPELAREGSREQGLDESNSELLYHTTEQLLTALDYIGAWRRGILTQEEMLKATDRLGYERNTMSTLVRLTEYFPSPSDLISFAVKDVYDPTVVQSLGLQAEFPEKFATEAAKQGIPRDQAINYWAAHWRLPSPTQGFEMLHRGSISRQELDLLLKAQDYAPFWREKLTTISYKPLTRTDTRRMFKLGVIDRETVKQNFKDQGYTEENAEFMTQFVERFEPNESVGLSRTSVEKAYKADLITEEEFRDFLNQLGYGESIIELYVSLANYDKLQDKYQLLADELMAQYFQGLITLADVRTSLGAGDAPSSFIDAIIAKIERQVSQKTKLPPKADLDRWLEHQLIDEADYAKRMAALGYRIEDIQIYLEEFGEDGVAVKTKFMTLDTYKRWLKNGLIDVKLFTNTLIKMGYKESEIQILIREVGANE